MIKASCSNCGKTFNAPDEYAGKKAKCPNCNQHLEIAPIEKTGKDQSRSIIAAAVAAAVGTAIPAFVLGVLLGVFAFSPNNRDKSVSTPVHLNRNQDTPERIAEKPEIREQMTHHQISQKWDEIKKEQQRTTQPEIPIYRVNENVIVGDVRWRLIKAQNIGNILSASGSRSSFSKSKRTTGKFIQITVEVENLSTELKSVTSRRMLDSRGRQFVSASDVDDWIPRDQDLFLLRNLNPNMPQIFSDIYEIPTDATGLMVRVSNLKVLGNKESLIQLGF